MRSSAWVGCVVLLLCLFFSWHAVGGLGQAGTVTGPTSAGDSNGDGNIDISDPVHTLNYLFTGGPPPALCQGGPDVLASNVVFDPTGTDLSALNVQAALREMNARIQAMSIEGTSITSRLTALEGEVEMEVVEIPAGSFSMGTPESEPRRGADETLHGVVITKAFSMGVTEVTQAQFRAVMGWNASAFSNCPECPVENVNWYDAVEFCDRLTARHRNEGRIDPEAFYRLPTESEWEYACRAGTTTAFSFGNIYAECPGDQFCATANAYVWWGGNIPETEQGPKPVKQKSPNPWGLYDMHGNVSEWCHDSYGSYPSGEVVDPTGPPGSLRRVFRGGSWREGLYATRSAARPWAWNSWSRESDGLIGFRVVLQHP